MVIYVNYMELGGIKILPRGTFLCLLALFFNLLALFFDLLVLFFDLLALLKLIALNMGESFNFLYITDNINIKEILISFISY